MMVRRRFRNFVDCIRDHADRIPSKAAFVFLPDSDAEEIRISYEQLDSRARAIAASLQRVARPGDRALLLFPSGLDFVEAFCGCLYAGVIAVPAYPARNAAHAARLARIVEDATPSVIMTLSDWVSHTAAAVPSPNVHWLTTDTSASIDTPAAWQGASFDSDRIAFLQYTSGSTGTPKGVIVSHGNLLDNQQQIHKAFGQTENAVVVGWLPLYHDMGLIGNVLHSLWLGAQGVLMAPLRFLRDPLRWLRAISTYRGTISGGPNFAYEWCTTRIKEEAKEGLDLSSWEVAFNGAEPIQRETLARFARSFARCGFRESAFKPCYGLAESTLLVSAVRLDETMHAPQAATRVATTSAASDQAEDAGEGLRVDCGAPASPVVIVDDFGQPVADGHEGEIWVESASVCGGYWNRPELSEATFRARLKNDASRGPFLRTGDLGFLNNGRLYIAGRLKDIIIIRGRNYHPQDIEEVVAQSHPAFRMGAGAAFGVSSPDGERLVVVHEVERDASADVDTLIQAARTAIAENLDLRLYAFVVLKPNTMPRTTSGKVQRFECRARFLDGSLRSSKEWRAGDAEPEVVSEEEALLSEDEAIIAALFSEVLPGARVGRDTSFFALGGDSIAAVDVSARINERFGCELTPVELYDHPTVAALAEVVRNRRSSAKPALALDVQSLATELTDVQEGIWLDIQRGVPDTAYHIPLHLELDSTTDVPTLERAWRQLVDACDSLRSIFVTRDGRPMRGQCAPERFDWRELHIHADSATQAMDRLALICRSAAARSFDLEAGPLWRIRVVKMPSGALHLVMVIHHLIVDGASLHRLYRQWMALYGALRAGQPAQDAAAYPPYATVVARQRAMRDNTAAYERARAYWLDTLGEARQAFLLPRDASERSMSARAATQVLRLGAQETAKLEALAASTDSGLFSVLLAGYAVILHRMTERRDVLIAVPVSEREDAQLASVIGPCLRTAILRIDIAPTDSFSEVLGRTRRALTDALRHAAFPLHALVRELRVQVAPGEFPFTTVAFNGLSFFDKNEASLAEAFRHDLDLGTRFDWNCYVVRGEGEIRLRLDYRDRLFRESTIAYLLDQLRALLNDAAERPQVAIAALAGFRPPAAPPRLPANSDTRPASLAERFVAISEQLADRVALRTPEVTLHYAELHQIAARIAAAVAARADGQDSNFVGILADNPIHAIQGILGVLLAGRGYVPLDPRQPDARLATMITDAEVTLLVTTRSCQARYQALGEILGTPLHIIELESLNTAALAAPVSLPRIAPDAPAYVLYTSGTTGRPKGVLQTQRNVGHYIDAYARAFGITAKDRLTLFSSFAHDAGVVDIFTALLHGASLYPLRVHAGDPLNEVPAWIEKHGITILHCTPSFYRALLSHAPGLMKASALRRVVLGGEPVQVEDAARHLAVLPAVSLVNLYGQTESTFNSFWFADPQHPRGRVLLGEPIEGMALRVLTDDGADTAVYATGMIIAESAHVSPGYWKRPAETERAFGADPTAPERRWYRTGDLGRRLPNGMIEFLGRRDGMVKLRGQRIELAEIVGHLRAHPGVANAAVVMRSETEQLAAYLVASPDVTIDALEARLRRYLPEYMVPTSWTRLPALPLTPNGKLDMAALPAPNGGEQPTEPVAPRNALEARVRAVFEEVLSHRPVGVHDSFFALGGNSLTAMRVLARLNSELGWRLMFADFMETPTVAGVLQAAGDRTHEILADAPLDADLPLSHAQRQLWTICQIEQASGAYNLFGAYEWKGPVDADRLAIALQQVVARHSSLRTTFYLVDGEPWQRVHQTVRLELARIDLSTAVDPLEQARALAARESAAAVDLTTAPLLWAALCRIAPDHHILMLRLPHIIADGWSMVVLVRDLVAYYGHGRASSEASPARKGLRGVPTERPEGPEAAADLAYWRSKLGGIAPLMLPTTYPRPAVKRFEGAMVREALGSAWTSRLRSVAAQERTSDFVALVALLETLLHRYTGQSDIAVGTALAHREQAEDQDQIGLYVSLIVLRDRVDGGQGFRALLRETAKTVSEAVRHGKYPFDQLVQDLAIARDPSRHPVFDVSITLDEDAGGLLAQVEPVLGHGVSIRPLRYQRATSKFDLSFAFRRGTDGLELEIEYDSRLFSEAWIRRIFGHLSQLLDGVASNLDRPIRHIDMLTPAERHELAARNATHIDVSRDWLLHRAVEQVAARVPTAVAIVSGEQRVTYGELNRRANGLAHHLRARGVRIGSPVLLCLERSIDFVVAALGVLKAGGVYVPFDPQNPKDRLAYVLTDTGAGVVITRDELRSHYGLDRASTICMDADRHELDSRETTNLPDGASPQDLAYIIYTSGSTGTPKGVMIEHRALANLLHWHCRTYGVTEASRSWLIASVGFDASIVELWPYLMTGASVYVIPDEHRADMAWLAAYARANALTHIFLPTRLYEYIAESGQTLPKGIQILVGGDQIRFRDMHGWQVWNNYGPTECTVVATVLNLGPPSPGSLIPIGRPVDNMRAYILDAGGQQTPDGIPGELYLAGAGLARGYWNQQTLTAERFVKVETLPSEQRLYRTGDLARFRDDGDIEFLGRLDHQVKIQGVRVEPGEVEAILIQNPAVHDAAVIAREDAAGEMRLVAYVVFEQNAAIGPDELRAEIAAKLPRSMWPSMVVPLERLPLNASGKVDRSRLHALDMAPMPRRHYMPPRDRYESLVVDTCRSLLHLAQAGVRDNFFELGGASIAATQLCARVREELGVHITLRDVFETATLGDLAARIASAVHAQRPESVQSTLSEAHPLSFAQERIWFLEQLDPTSQVYNVHGALRLRGPLSLESLQRALALVVERHEPLRTVFPAVSGKPEIRIIDRWIPEIRLVDAREDELQARIQAEAQQPFDLAQGPLLRAQLLRMSPSEHVLLVTMHHIISDGWSVGVLVREWLTLYQAQVSRIPAALPELTLRYSEHARWQRTWLQGEALDAVLSYWREHLSGLPPVLSLPSDRPRPAIQSYRGERLTLDLPVHLRDALRALGQQHGATLFSTVAAAFGVLLSRYSGQRDIAIGYPVAGRDRPALDGLIGLFVNTLVLRCTLHPDQNFVELLRQVQERMLAGQEHQSAPFDRVVDALQPVRSLSHSPLFQVMLVLQPAPLEAQRVGELLIQPMPQHSIAAKVDLTLEVEEGAHGLRTSWIYSTALFDRDTIARMAEHLHVLLEGVLRAPTARIASLPLLTSQERQMLLVDWNDTAAPYPATRCIHELFDEQVARTPDAIAVVHGYAQCSFRQLARRANQLAHYLIARGIGPESRVGICTTRNIDMVVGLLGILKAGAAYVPLDPAYPEARIAHIVSDARPELLLTEEALRARCQPAGISMLCLDTEWPQVAVHGNGPVPAAVSSEQLAYIIYTSGSTGRPKGVGISHRNVVALLAWAAATFDQHERSGVLASTSLCFDLSVFEVFLPLVAGGTVMLAGDALDLPELPYRDHITLVNTVPSAMEALLRGSALPSSVRTINLAGEALSRELAAAVYRCTHVRRLMNLYGPSEDTVYSTGAWVQATSDDKPLIGRPIANRAAYVLDSKLQPVPVGVPGELYLSGAGLARGYHGLPRTTADRFIPNAFAMSPGQRLYRTGDLVKYRASGDLEFLGRLDHQVKLRGFRIELGEIEAVLLGQPGIRQAVVVVREDRRGDKYLAAFVVPEETHTLDAAALRASLGAQLPAYMVPATIMVLEALPLTANGKVDRSALPAVDVQTAAPALHIAPRTATEMRIAAVWAEILGRAQIGIHEDFFAIGGHSLLATQVVTRIRELLSVELPLKALFEQPTVAGLAELVEARRHSSLRQPPLVASTAQGPYPLSFAQQRLWILYRLFPDSNLYNMPMAVRIRGALELEALRKSLVRLTRRHELLRARIVEQDDVPAMRVDDAWEPAIPVIEAQEAELPARIRAVVEQPFDLVREPLLRAALLRLAADDHVLLLTMHHMVSDAWSVGILIREWMALYEAQVTGTLPSLPQLPVRYWDYARWQSQWLIDDVIDAELAYWRGRLEGLPPLLELPTDRPRPPVQSTSGAAVPFMVPGPLARALGALGRERGTTMFMMLAAAFATLLSRYSRQSDIAIGYPNAGRIRPELQGLVGLFVNTLILRCNVDPQQTFAELLDAVRLHVVEGYEHQAVPFEKVVDALRPARSLSHTPLFQVMLALQNAPKQALQLPGLAIEQVAQERTVTKFDLLLDVEETDDGIRGTWVYSTALFDRATIERMSRHLGTLLASIVATPSARIGELSMLSEDERREMIYGCNQTAVAFDAPACLHELVEAQADRTPDAPALRQGDRVMSYQELDQRANGVARRLRELGIQAGDRVGICMERSLELIVATIGILKAGAAYVPLDPDYPAARLQYMWTNSGARVLILSPALDTVALDASQKLLLGPESLPMPEPVRMASGVSPDMPAYVMYTSGTTGQPKGAMVTHRGIRNRILWGQHAYNLETTARVLHKAPFSFDAAVWEVFWPLSMGATLVVAPPGIHRDLEALADFVVRESINVIHFVPSLLERALESGVLARCRSLTRVYLGGEVLTTATVERLLDILDVRVFNQYGPTETAANVVYAEYRRDLHRQRRTVPLGRPIANTQIYILDDNGAPVPYGLTGEIYVGGENVGLGYLGLPEETKARFLPDPFAGGNARMYRTGDLARWRPDQTIEFLGRRDRQVKVRGVRIELAEIEALLLEHPAVSDAVVVVREDADGEPQLVAYAVAEERQRQSIRAYLHGALPIAMVPSALVMLQALPLGPTGKVDTRLLPPPDASARAGSAGTDAVLPRNEVEQRLTALWQEMLKMEHLGVTDNFFDLGGHSLLATQVASRVARIFDVELPLRVFFSRPTIAELATYIDAILQARADAHLAVDSADTDREEIEI